MSLLDPTTGKETAHANPLIGAMSGVFQVSDDHLQGCCGAKR